MQSTSTFPFHFHFHVLDADGLRDFIILHSNYNVVTEDMQSEDRYFVPPNQSIEDIPNDIQHLYLCGFNEYDQEQLIFSNNSFNQLKSISIGKDCFKNVREFVLDGLEIVESVKIGQYCFSMSEEEEEEEDDDDDDDEERNVDGFCQITNCPNLRQLEIGWHSFEDFKSFELSNVNSLQSIDFGRGCFRYADFSLKGE